MTEFNTLLCCTFVHDVSKWTEHKYLLVIEHGMPQPSHTHSSKSQVSSSATQQQAVELAMSYERCAKSLHSSMQCKYDTLGGDGQP